MDKNNFNKFINNFEIHCDKIFPMREDPFKIHEEAVDLKMLNKQKEKIVELNESMNQAELALSNLKDKDDDTKNIKNQKSIIKERQEMMVKNKDFLIALFKKFVETQDEEIDLEF